MPYNRNKKTTVGQLENTTSAIKSKIDILQDFMTHSRLFIDSDGNLAQNDPEEEEEVQS